MASAFAGSRWDTSHSVITETSKTQMIKVIWRLLCTTSSNKTPELPTQSVVLRCHFMWRISRRPTGLLTRKKLHKLGGQHQKQVLLTPCFPQVQGLRSCSDEGWSILCSAADRRALEPELAGLHQHKPLCWLWLNSVGYRIKYSITSQFLWAASH